MLRAGTPCIIPKLLPPRKINARFSFDEEAESKKDKMDYQRDGERRKKCLQDSKVAECNTEMGEREIYRRYKETGAYPYPNKPGRKPSLISDEERRIVLEIRKQHPVCAVTLEKILDREGIHIPHNRIHRILKEEGLSKNEPIKQKCRKWYSKTGYDRSWSAVYKHPKRRLLDPKPNVFQKRLKEYGIKHIKARVKHPRVTVRLRRHQIQS